MENALKKLFYFANRKKMRKNFYQLHKHNMRSFGKTLELIRQLQEVNINRDGENARCNNNGKPN